MRSNPAVPREAALIVNTHSRKGARLFRKAKAELEEAGIRLVAAHGIKKPAELTKKVQEAAASGVPMVIVGGGDGSLASAVDYVLDHDCVFAVLPLGTANSFARTLGIPLDLAGAVDTIVHGRLRRIDLGVIDGDYFVNSAAIGLSPLVGQSVPKKLKRALGRIGYLLWAVWSLLRFRAFELQVDMDGKVHALSALEVRIANGSFHGGVEVVEEAHVESGDIVVQAVVGRTRSRLVVSWLATLLKLPGRKETVVEYRGSRLRLITMPPLPISIDGEVTGRTPATVEVAERAIWIVAPQVAP